ncbi:DNA-binding transcriptional repressor DeoR [Nissabacter sp. SGAir0207]|uniref:DNA-binding transcriptional repressor DeoR n=1 Tax=Nissabacter sp. SGAir0207 TaxID=2126321 RepID=UPI0010CD5B2C|nr:DNA-binding transcriptional repressor DeoR [Nissabacter sp. SGAir0207]QCR35804.1 DNA-binding transcriptional repressor DeoR [Nissabacter sp. SGAir0207]
METRREERIQRLVQALKRSDKIHLKEAAALLGVSEMTIRRDLSAQPSSVVLLGGYVVIDPKASSVTSYFVSDQQGKQVEEKRHVGRLAAQCIAADDTVFFDCGTTIPYIIDAIDEALPFTAVCYSLNTFLALQDKPLCKVVLCGGEFRPDSYIFTPLAGRNLMENICPTKAFISAAGIHLEQGVSCYNFEEIEMKHRALAGAGQRILVVDHTKFGKVKPARVGDLTLFDTVITNRPPEPAYARYLKEHRITLLS